MVSAAFRFAFVFLALHWIPIQKLEDCGWELVGGEDVAKTRGMGLGLGDTNTPRLLKRKDQQVKCSMRVQIINAQ